MKRRRVAGIAVIVALVGCAALSPLARASTYQLSPLGVDRSNSRGSDYGYLGPPFVVTSWGTSLDTYVCPPGQQMSNWVAAPEDLTSEKNWTDWVSDHGNSFNVHVTYWGRWSKPPPLHLRVAASCTNNPHEFPFQSSVIWYPPGDYQAFWHDVLTAGSPSKADYGELVKRAFCWSTSYPRCAEKATPPKATRRFAVHDGIDAIKLRIRDSSLTLPPAIRLTEPAGCTAQRMQLSVEQRSGYLRLLLRCHGLKRGAAARVRIAKPVRLSFRLHNGRGSVEVRLAKPPGAANPLLYLAYGRATKSCSSVRSQLRNHSRTFDLRVSARCGRAAGDAMAHLYIGGLLR